MSYQHSTLRGYAWLIIGDGCDMRGMKRGTVRTTRVLIIGFMAERVPSRTLAVFASLDLIVPQLCLARHVENQWPREA